MTEDQKSWIIGSFLAAILMLVGYTVAPSTITAPCPPTTGAKE